MRCGIEIPVEYEPYQNNEKPDLNCGDVIVNKHDAMQKLITMCDKTGRKGCFIYANTWINNDSLFNHYTKADGTPIGRIKETK